MSELPRWRWLPGMRDTDGCRVVDIIDPWLLLACGDVGVGNWTLPLRAVEWCNANMLPDLDDPATCGCIENTLLPEAWPGAIITKRTDQWGTLIRIASIDDELFDFFDARLGVALMAALRGAP